MRRGWLPAVRRTRPVEILWRLHLWIVRVSRGRLGGRLGPTPVMLLTTQGRRSGVPRTVALTFFREGPAYVVVASNAGEDADPAWWLNLKARPEATVNIGGDESSVVAREARGEERESLWRRITASEPSYAAYQRRTARRIPIVVLEPRGTL